MSETPDQSDQLPEEGLPQATPEDDADEERVSEEGGP